MHPIIINLFSLPIYTQSIFIIVGIVIGLFISWRKGRILGYDEVKLLKASLLSVIVGFIGSKLTYMLIVSIFIKLPINIKSIYLMQPQYISLVGGIITALIFLYYLTRRTRWAYLLTTDFLFEGLFFGNIFIHFGSFFDNNVIGKVTNGPWGLYSNYFIGKRHPAELYVIGVLLITYCIYFISKRWIKYNTGDQTIIFLIFILLADVTNYTFLAFNAGIEQKFASLSTTLNIFIIGIVTAYFVIYRKKVLQYIKQKLILITNKNKNDQ